MARLSVNPTRMELTRLKRRIVTARRGHKLLKDKLDGMMKQFLEFVRANMALRIDVEKGLAESYQGFSSAAAIMSPNQLEQSFLFPKQSVSVDIGFRSIMSVTVPIYHIETKTDDAMVIIPYGFANTPGELDDSVIRLSKLLDSMMRLAEAEKTAKLLAREIEKTRRRVNALEYVLIPNLVETIRYITLKLDENERGNLTRLMKVKDMMLEEAGYGQKDKESTPA
ncbi:MAG: V-type ATP synthase subunit D [Clostridiales bacterium]|nr:V-type ATP synthase subunit D [Clostridiales bacterium]